MVIYKGFPSVKLYYQESIVSKKNAKIIISLNNEEQIKKMFLGYITTRIFFYNQSILNRLQGVCFTEGLKTIINVFDDLKKNL